MRWIVLILLGLFLFSSAGVVSAVGEGSVIAYWQMENNLDDSIGSHDGSWDSGGTPGYGSLDVGSASKFLGEEKIMVLHDDDLRFEDAFTIEMYISDTASPADSSAVLFEKGSYKIGTNGSRNIVATAGGVNITSSSAIVRRDYHHIALVWDAGSIGNNLKLYIDGNNVGSVELLSAIPTTEELWIGENFKGLIDEVAIFDSALSEEDIRFHMNLLLAGKHYFDSSGVGGTSSTTTGFNIKGCTFNFGGGTIGVSRGKCSIHPVAADGKFFCDDDLFNWSTEEAGFGCSLGASSYILGEDFCCPPLMFCNESTPTSGLYECDVREVNCFEMNGDEDECADAGCFWFEKEGICSDGKRDRGCEYYKTSGDCETDAYELGTDGIGTEKCGTYIYCDVGNPELDPFSVKCGCAWVGTNDDGDCQIEMSAAQTFFGDVVSQKGFNCSSSYNLEECIDGKQVVDWTSTISNWPGIKGLTDTQLTDCADLLGCESGFGERSCGEELIKLPGFSLFGFFISLFVIGMYYVVVRKDE